MAEPPSVPVDTDPVDTDNVPLNAFVRRLAVYSAGGPLLDGYALSTIGIAFVQATPQLSLTPSDQGLIGAAALIGIFVGGFAGGWLTDRFGRQKLYTIDLLAIVVFSAVQFWAADATQLFVMRLALGVAIGADYPIATALLSEFAPTRHRGRLLGGLIVVWLLGSAVAYLVGSALLPLSPTAWRWLLASPALPALVFMALRHGTPESPRWLASQGRLGEADEVHRLAFGTPYVATASETAQAGTPWFAVFRGGYGRRTAFVAGFWGCSIVPLFAIYSFGPALLDALGLTAGYVDLGSIVVTVFLLLGSFLALALMDRVGRRPLLIHSFLWCGVVFVGLALAGPRSPMLIMLLLIGYSLAISPTLVMQWVYPNELFPTSVRGTAVGVASSLSRIGAAIGTYLVPLGLDRIGIHATMWIAAAINGAGLLVALAAPETRGRSLDETSALSP